MYMAHALCGVRHPPYTHMISQFCERRGTAPQSRVRHRYSRTGGPLRSPRRDTDRRYCGSRCANIESAATRCCGHTGAANDIAHAVAAAVGCSMHSRRTLPSIRKNRLRATSPSRDTTVPAASISVRSRGHSCTGDLVRRPGKRAIASNTATEPHTRARQTARRDRFQAVSSA